MKIVNLTKNDVDSIVQLNLSCFPDGWNQSMLNSAFDDGRFYCIGAFDDDKLIGALSYSVSVDDADIESVVVIPEYRKSGVAKALVSLAIVKLELLGKQKVFLEVRKSNIPAISLYEKFEFNKISVRKRYYSDGEDAIIMVKDLIERN